MLVSSIHSMAQWENLTLFFEHHECQVMKRSRLYHISQKSHTLSFDRFGGHGRAGGTSLHRFPYAFQMLMPGFSIESCQTGFLILYTNDQSHMGEACC